MSWGEAIQIILSDPLSTTEAAAGLVAVVMILVTSAWLPGVVRSWLERRRQPPPPTFVAARDADPRSPWAVPPLKAPVPWSMSYVRRARRELRVATGSIAVVTLPNVAVATVVTPMELVVKIERVRINPREQVHDSHRPSQDLLVILDRVQGDRRPGPLHRVVQVPALDCELKTGDVLRLRSGTGLDMGVYHVRFLVDDGRCLGGVWEDVPDHLMPFATAWV